MELIIATHNPHKVEEFTRILAPLGVAAKAAELTEIEETGDSFAENAFLKAAAACRETGLPAVADDAGLCVDALGGAPGIYSARYAEPGQRKKKLLAELANLPMERRGARFVSAICCVFPDGRVLRAEGFCRGRVALTPRGESGFGYDPVFEVDGKTFAEMTAAEKDAISHRGAALRTFTRALARLLEES